jgi:hypothetical protein
LREKNSEACKNVGSESVKQALVVGKGLSHASIADSLLYYDGSI